MANKTFITWKEYDDMVDKIAIYAQQYPSGEIGAVYGLPRGGLPIAVSLSHKLGLPLLMNYYDRKVVTRKKVLVVDDIADTGHTLKDFDSPHNIICTMHYHQDSITKPNYYIELKGDKWIVYPWETRDSEEVQDYLKDDNDGGDNKKSNRHPGDTSDEGLMWHPV